MISKPIIILSLMAGALTPLLLSPFVIKAANLDRIILNDSILPIPVTARNAVVANPNAPVEFQIALKMRNQSDLEVRVAKGEIISGAEMIAKYYPLSTDYESLLSWLKLQGLTIQETFANHLTIEVSGSVAQVQKALGSEFISVTVKDSTYTAARTAPSLPRNLAQFVVGVNGLQPYQQAYVPRPPQRASLPRPPYFVKDIQKAYNADSLEVDGSGQTIAILIDRFPLDSDLTQFWAANNIPQSLKNIQKISVVKSIPNRKPLEATVDVQWSSSIAPNAKVRIYGTGSLSFANLDKGLQRMLVNLHNQRTFNQLSISLGGCEAETPIAQKITDNLLLTAITSAGVSILAASGDNGSQGICDRTMKSGVSYYSSYPSVTGVGGTTLELNNDGTIQSEIGWVGSGGGNSTFFDRPSWQVGLGVPGGRTRLVPDVSINALGYYFVFRGRVGFAGGTSVSAPVWAGFSALTNQARANQGKPALGFLNPRIYKLLGTPSFRDITRGNNGGFKAVKGYDRVTGIGVPVVNVLLPTLVRQP